MRTSLHSFSIRRLHALDITRLIGIAGIFFLHFGFAMCLKLEEFVWVRTLNTCITQLTRQIGCTASFCCIPSWIWDVWIPRLRAKGSHLTREIRVVRNVSR